MGCPETGLTVNALAKSLMYGYAGHQVCVADDDSCVAFLVEVVDAKRRVNEWKPKERKGSGNYSMIQHVIDILLVYIQHYDKTRPIALHVCCAMSF